MSTDRPNTNYGQRAVSVGEIVAVFGSAAAAYRATGGDERLALFYLANPERVVDAPKVKPLRGHDAQAPFPVALRQQRDADEATEREAASVRRADRERIDALRAWEASPTMKSVMAGARIGRKKARQFIADFKRHADRA